MPYEDIEKGFERIMREDLKFRGDKTDHIEVIIDDGIDGNFYGHDICIYVSSANADMHRIEFGISEMPGCCGYAVICNYTLGNENANTSRMSERMIEVVKMLEKTVAYYNWPFAMIQTVKVENHGTIYNRKENEILTQALKKRGWTLVHSGKNYKSENKMFTWVKRVRYKE